jgi:ribosomal protein L11 methyltransferase
VTAARFVEIMDGVQKTNRADVTERSSARRHSMWWRAHIRAEAASADAVAGGIWAAGAEGCEVRDADTFSAFHSSAFARGDGTQIELLAYFQSEDRERLARRLAELPAEARLVALEAVDEAAWRDGWRQFFRPTRVSRRIAVTPSWSKDELPSDAAAASVVLVVDPQMAFGTGTHETTRLCLSEIDDYLAAQADVSLLDVGTGSGILAMAAHRLGARCCLGIDIDAEAVRVARANWELNGLGPAHQAPFVARSLDQLDEVYDLVVANILSGVLRGLRDGLVARTRPGGHLVLSGLLAEEASRFAAEFAASDDGLQLEATRTAGEWALLRFERR